MRDYENAKRRLRQLIRDELVRIGLKTVVRETVHELHDELYEPEQQRRPDLKVVQR